MANLTPSQGTCNAADPVDCDLGEIAANGQATIDLVVTIGQNQSGNQIDNTACADTSTTDTDPNNDCDIAPIDVEPEADLAITKTAPTGPYAAGDNVSFILTVTNNGPNSADNVEVTDDLPASLTFVSATPEQGTCNAADPIDCDLGTIANGASVDITVVATIAADQSGNQITNTACAETSTTDPEDGNDCEGKTIDVEPEADLAIVKTVDPKGAVAVGELLTYTLVVTNNGPNAVNNAAVMDDFDGDVDIVSATPSQGTCSTTDPIECELGSMAVDAEVAITVKARPLHDGRLVNDAVVTSENPDSDPTNNEDDASVRIAPTRLEIKKRANRTKAEVGDVIRYGIVVRSRTAVTLHDVEVCDKVPKTLDLVSAPGAKIRGNKACWRLDLPPRAKRTFKVKAKVNPVNYDLKVVNTAKVIGDDIAPADDKEKVRVQGEPPAGPEPCPGRAATLRC